MTSFVSAKGPSVTVTFPPVLLWRRTPVAPKLTPSVAISHPAFMPSSMSLPIVAISASVGGRFVGSCVKMLMNRMPVLLGSHCPCTMLSNGGAINRHDAQRVFASDAALSAGARYAVLKNAGNLLIHVSHARSASCGVHRGSPA